MTANLIVSHHLKKHCGELVLPILSGIVCCILPFTFTGVGLFSYEIRIATCVLLFVGMMLGIIYSKRGLKVSITRNDVFVFVYVLYGGSRACVDGGDIPSSWVSQWIFLIMVYVVSRNTNHRLLPLFFWISGTCQAFLALGQALGYVESNHTFFKVTGCFWNPSQLGGFVACLLPLVVSEFAHRRCSVRYGLILLPIIYALFLSDSRAAWVTCVVGLCYLFPVRMRGRYALVIVSCLIVLACGALYFYKPHSALGRLRVWHICGEMIQAKPWWGSGVHSFRSEYMLYQADYFYHHPGDVFADTATVVTTPYNEFIHVFVEQGGVGFILFLIMVGQFLFLSPGKENKKYQSVVLAFLCFSCFSYPGENIALLFVAVVCMGAVRGKTWLSPRLYLSRVLVIVLVLIGCMAWAIKDIQAYNSLSLVAKQPLETADIPRYRCEPEALQYLLRANKNLEVRDRLIMQKWISESTPTPETYCKLGDLYEQAREYDRAERCYRVAADMIPNQIRAKYFLFKLYEKSGRLSDAMRMANMISRQKVKVENSFTLSVKGEVGRYLKGAH